MCIRDRAWERTFISDGTITTEPKNKKKVTGEDVDNYKSGAVKVAPVEKSGDDPSIKAARGGIYASFAHQNMLNILAEKAACKKKKKKTYSEATVNTKDCEKKPEEKEKDMRGYYAKINLVKNKIRSMGVKDPCIVADPDDVDKTWDDKCVKDGIKDKDDDKKVNEDKTTVAPTHKPGEKNSQYEKDGTKKKKDTRYNPFKDGRTPTSASETTGP